MKTITKNAVIVVVLTVAFVMLAGCSSNSNSALIGRWRGVTLPDTVIEFNRDGTGLVNDSIAITWSAENGRLTLDGFPEVYSFSSLFEFNGVRDYRITESEGGGVHLLIWVELNSPHAAPSDASVGFQRLGEN